METIDVAIAIVLNEERVLICQRKSGGTFGGLWELPGGKVEHGETPASCVVREVAEELGIAVEPIKSVGIIEHVYPTFRVRLHAFDCRWLSGQPKPLACAAIRWAGGNDLAGYSFPEANAPLLAELRTRLAGGAERR